MNLSHVIDEFSFGKYFPNIVQPLDNSAETTSARKSPLIVVLGLMLTSPR